MALTDENGNGMVMPVAPMGYGGYGNGGFGGFGSDAWLILIILFAMGGWGMGGFGGFGGVGGEYAFPWLLASNANNQNATQDGFNQAATAGALSGLQGTVSSGFGDVQLGIAGVNQNICQTGNQITAAVTNAAAQAEIAAGSRNSALTQQLYNNEINSLNRSFAEQSANTAAINGVQNAVTQVGCRQDANTADLKYTIATENCADRAALNDGIRDILVATQAQNQRILDKLCDQELQAERRENSELRSRINMLDLAASQAQQTAAIEASQNAQTQYIVNRVAPYPIPAFPVNNPYGWNGAYGSGFGGYGYNYGYGVG